MYISYKLSYRSVSRLVCGFQPVFRTSKLFHAYCARTPISISFKFSAETKH